MSNAPRRQMERDHISEMPSAREHSNNALFPENDEKKTDSANISNSGGFSGSARTVRRSGADRDKTGRRRRGAARSSAEATPTSPPPQPSAGTNLLRGIRGQWRAASPHSELIEPPCRLPLRAAPRRAAPRAGQALSNGLAAKSPGIQSLIRNGGT